MNLNESDGAAFQNNDLGSEAYTGLSNMLKFGIGSSLNGSSIRVGSVRNEFEFQYK